jgi:endonuclease/exonuclease/phosphatase family metal-dependent hydrolase
MRRFLTLALTILLLSYPAQAESLKIATWNMEWLTARPAGDAALPSDAHPKQPDDIARLHNYATLLKADVVAFEEVDGPEIAARIFPADQYQLHVTGDHVVQRVGFAVRRGVAFTANSDATGLDLYPNATFPLRSGADITLRTPDGPLRLLAVHLKTGCRNAALTGSNPSCTILRKQMAPLEAWIAARQAEGVAYIILGDFNRWMDNGDAFWAGLTTAAPLLRATAGKSSPCWGGGGFIDHIIAGGAARSWMQPDSLRVLVYREREPEWKERLSDHCPVSVRFDLPG